MRAVSRTVASQVQWKPDHSVARIRSYVPGASNLSYIGRHLPTAHLGHHVLSVGEVDALTWGIIAVVNPPDDLRDVLANELRLLDPAVRRSRDAMLRLLHEDFRKVGASVAHGTATPSSRPWPRRSGMVLSPQRIRAPSRTGPIGARWDTGLVTACCIRLRRWSPDDTRHDRPSGRQRGGDWHTYRAPPTSTTSSCRPRGASWSSVPGLYARGYTVERWQRTVRWRRRRAFRFRIACPSLRWHHERVRADVARAGSTGWAQGLRGPGCG